MSQIDLSVAKARLRIISSEEDVNLQQALEGAEQEACRFMNREELPTLPLEYQSSEPVPSSEDAVAPDAVEGVLLLVRANYDADTPEEIAKFREAAETKLMPYRKYLGV